LFPSRVRRVEEIVQNVDLAPTFLDIAGVQVPPHMDGKSILPLIINRHRSIKFKWPDTFLIESSGRRETPEQLAEQRARAAAAKYTQMLNENNNKMELTLVENRTYEEMKHREHDFSSHEIEDDGDDEEDEDIDDIVDDSDLDADLQRDQPKKRSVKRRRKHREGEFSLFETIYIKNFSPQLSITLAITSTTTFRPTNRNWRDSMWSVPTMRCFWTVSPVKSGSV
jgi:hypothetical protein